MCRFFYFTSLAADYIFIFPKAGRESRLWRPDSSRHGAHAPGGSGSAHRAGWFRGQFYMPPPTGGYILIARRAIPPPSEPFEPFEPSRPKGVSNGDTTTLSGQRPLSNFRTLRTFGPLGPSILQRPKGAEPYSSAFPSSTISAAFSHRSPRRRPAAKKRSQDMLEEERGRDSMNASSRGMESPAAFRAS